MSSPALKKHKLSKDGIIDLTLPSESGPSPDPKGKSIAVDSDEILDLTNLSDDETPGKVMSQDILELVRILCKDVSEIKKAIMVKN